MNDQDRRLLEAIDYIGPVSVYALFYHTAAAGFETTDGLEGRLKALSKSGHLQGRALPDVTGDNVTEYDTVAGWAE